MGRGGGGSSTEAGTQYSAGMGYIFVFNLIVGAGAMTLPKAFADAGAILATAMLVVLCLFSFIAVTFVNESMAAANAMLQFKRLDGEDDDEFDSSEDKAKLVGKRRGYAASSGSYSSLPNGDDDEEGAEVGDHLISSDKQALVQPVNCDIDEAGGAEAGDQFDIKRRVEMGYMAKMFFGRKALIAFYLIIILYLYGDLCIYVVMIPKSLAQVTCPQNVTNPSVTTGPARHCFGPFDSWNVYYLYVTVLAVTLGPLCYFNVQKTKYLQVLTTVMRYTAFLSMITLAMIMIVNEHEVVELRDGWLWGRIDGIPNLFGVAIYSAMCQHSLPSLVTPIRNKERLTSLMFLDMMSVMSFYLMLCYSAVFRFPNDELMDVYTSNFDFSGRDRAFFGAALSGFFKYFLGLFPVFTLSASFPIICITLVNNLRTLFHREGRPYHWAVDRLAFPTAALLPPIGVAYLTRDVELLAGVTGSYAGVGVQYLIPAYLVWQARTAVAKAFGGADALQSRARTHAVGTQLNKHASPFRSVYWIYFILVWSFVCVTLITVNHIMQGK